MAAKSKDTTLTSEHNSYASYGVSLRKQVCGLLDENSLLMPKMLAKLLDFTPKEYKKQRQTLTNYRNYWKYNHGNERGSKCSSFHCFKAKVKLDLVLSQALRHVVKLDIENEVFFYGWVQSAARNRFLVWKGRFGRVVWFETGTVTLHVRRPGNLGKAKQLFCDAFVNTGLLTDMKVLNPVLERIRPKSGHFPYSSGERLPYMVIRDFEESHGIVIKVGDRTHPDAVEVIAGFSDVMDGALDKLEKLEKNDVKNGEALRNEIYEFKNQHSESIQDLKKEVVVLRTKNEELISVNTELVKANIATVQEVKILSSQVKSLLDALQGVQQKTKGPEVTVATTQNIELNRIYE